MRAAIKWTSLAFLSLLLGLLMFAAAAPGIAPMTPLADVAAPHEMPSPNVADIVAGVVASYVEVAVFDEGSRPLGSASAVILQVDGETLALTCKHVAEYCVAPCHCKLIKVSEELGVRTEWDATVAYLSATHDLALLKPAEPTGLKPAVFLGDVKLERGEDCWYCGTPRGFHSSLEKSIINHPHCDADGERGFTVNGNGWYGNSGCGVYVLRDSKFVLVGILSRLVWVDPRTPLFCQGQAAIKAVLCDYKKGCVK